MGPLRRLQCALADCQWKIMLHQGNVWLPRKACTLLSMQWGTAGNSWTGAKAWVEKTNVWMVFSTHGDWQLEDNGGGLEDALFWAVGSVGRKAEGMEMGKDSRGLSWLVLLWTFKLGCSRRQWCLRQERAANTRKGLGKKGVQLLIQSPEDIKLEVFLLITLLHFLLLILLIFLFLQPQQSPPLSLPF